MTNQSPPSLPARRSRLGPLAPILAAVCVAASVGSAHAAMPVELGAPRIGFGPANTFKIGAWTPVWVELKGGPAPFKGFMDVVVGDDDGVPTSFRREVEVPAGESRLVSAHVRPGGRDLELAFRFHDEQGRWLGERSQARLLRSEPTALMPDTTLILTAGQPQGVDQIGTVAGFQRTGSGPGNAEVVVIRIDDQEEGERVPEGWLGYDGVTALVIDTADAATLKRFEGDKGEAVVDWVKRGGHLVLSVGGNWEAVGKSALASILPALPVGQERIQSLEALDTFAGSNKSVTPPGTPPQTVVKLEEVDKRGGVALSVMANHPLVVRGPAGFGRVTLIGVDVDGKLFADWQDRGLFWVRALDLRSQRAETVAGPSMGGSGTRFQTSGVTDLASQLRVAMEQFSGVALVPFGWIAFLAFLYIVAIGPGDYLFLRRILGRMELTWITFPLMVAAASALAYYAAQRLKGNELRINKVDLVDVDQAAGLARGRSWATLFSPGNRDYDLGFWPVAMNGEEAEPMFHQQKPKEISGAIIRRLPPGTEVVTSWFGVPENQFGAMGGTNSRFTFTGPGYSYEPPGAVRELKRLRVPIWSAKTVVSRWFGPAEPLVDSDLQPFGFDRVSGTITNRQSYPLDDALLAFGKQVYLLGPIAPGQTIRVELAHNRNLSGLLKDRRENYQPPSSADPSKKLDRGDLLLAIMFHESESTRALGGRALANSQLRDLDLTGQLALGRPMLVARVDRPAAQLAVGNAPGEPKIDQTTMLRVILPMKSARP